MGLNKLLPLSQMLSKRMGLPYLIKIAPILWPKASYSTKNVFVKSDVARMGVVHISSSIFSKYLVASLVQENVSFLIMLLYVLLFDHNY